jgi:hypothetical protein
MLVPSPTRHAVVSAIGNILWFLLAGWWLALGHVLTGILLCLTIIGMPLGIANFKMAGAALVPLWKEIVSVDDLRSVPQGAVVIGNNTSRDLIDPPRGRLRATKTKAWPRARRALEVVDEHEERLLRAELEHEAEHAAAMRNRSGSAGSARPSAAASAAACGPGRPRRRSTTEWNA